IYASSQNSTTGSEVLFVGNVLSYTDGSLANGQTYYYWVSAVNSVGEGPKSDEGAAIPYTIPDSPTGFTAIAGDGQVTLNWTAPAFDGGRAIDYYIVYQDGYALLDHAIGLTDVITGLTNGQSPSFAVAAHNLAGNGTLSIAVSSTPYTVPDAPTGLQAIAGNDQVSLNWTVPVFDGGRAIDYYLIYEDGVALPDHVSDVTEIITGLINGQNYHFSVAAHNTGGIGNESGGVSSIPFTFPNAATGLTAIAGDGKAALNWSIPSSDGGREVDYYVVYQDGVALPNHPTGSTDVITGLTNGQSYSFTVAAHNIAGLGLQSIAVSAIPFTIPDAPIGLVATVGNAQVTLNWTAPAFDGGRAIDYYVIHEDGIALPGLRTGVMTVISGLDNGRNYSFAVAAYNLAGNGTLSIAVSSTPYTVPDAPTGLQAIAGDDQVTLSWTAPTDDGGRAIDYYVVYQNGAAFLDHVVGLTTVIASLINGQSYSFMVAAHNLAGIGTQSLAASGTPVTVPNAPTWLMAISGNAQVTLNWTAPASDGGSPVTDYKIYRSTTPDGNYSLVATPTVLAYTDTGLTNGQTYYYKVYACNIVGDGPMTAVVNTTPQAPSSTDTMTFYIGIGAVVIVAAIGAAVLVMRRRK
ncbi:MAG: fibronectin type III domain-containing protein, partial [Methanomassiliicoccales archaeon]